jgi:hypothetical protein
MVKSIVIKPSDSSMLANYLATLKVEEDENILASPSASSNCFCISSASALTSSCSSSFSSSPPISHQLTGSSSIISKEKKEDKEEKGSSESISKAKHRSRSSERRKEKSKEEKNTSGEKHAEIVAQSVHQQTPGSTKSEEKPRKSRTPLIDKYLTEKRLNQEYTSSKNAKGFISTANPTISITNSHKSKQDAANSKETTELKEISESESHNKRKIVECSCGDFRSTSRTPKDRLSYGERYSSMVKNTPTSSPLLKKAYYGHRSSQSRDKSNNESIEEDKFKKELKKSNNERAEDTSRKSDNHSYQDFSDNYETLVKSKLIKFFKMKSLEWKNYSKNLVDTHCHFDMLFSRYFFY